MADGWIEIRNFISMKTILFSFTFLIAGINSSSQSIPKWKITDVEHLIASTNEGVQVINFWATFCKPCVAEIPYFISVVNRYKTKNVQLTLVSVDLPSQYPAKIASYTKKHRFNTKITWLEETDADYFCPKVDTNWSGSIPATLIINSKTGYRKFFEEEMTEEQFETELKQALGER
jgi:thiol-disulfide isomerase/thioredoxin